MIFAELQGKLGQNHSRAHERAEDVLTSTVFGLLRYLPLDAWLAPLLARVRTGPEFAVDPGWLNVTDVSRCDMRLWQRRSPFGEPDVMMRLFDAQGRLRHLLIIEVKLYSPKSGSADWAEPADAEQNEGDEGSEIEGIDQDQLARYWLYANNELDRLRTSHPTDNAEAPTASLVYLTAHVTAPAEEMEVSEAAAVRLQAADQPIRLAWLSWFDVWRVAYEISKRGQGPLAAHDIERLLTHKGFRQFVGFEGAEAPQPAWFRAPARFWQRRGWFSFNRPAPIGEARFWKHAEPSR